MGEYVLFWFSLCKCQSLNYRDARASIITASQVTHTGSGFKGIPFELYISQLAIVVLTHFSRVLQRFKPPTWVTT